MLSIGIRAKNSSGIQHLYASRGSEGVDLTLVGEYKGEMIQIDFDSLSNDEVDEFVQVLISKKSKPTFISLLP